MKELKMNLDNYIDLDKAIVYDFDEFSDLVRNKNIEEGHGYGYIEDKGMLIDFHSKLKANLNIFDVVGMYNKGLLKTSAEKYLNKCKIVYFK